MKTLSSYIKKILPKINPNLLVHEIAVVGVWEVLKKPELSNNIKCLVCGSCDHYAVYIDPHSKSDRRVWICANPICESTNLKNMLPSTYTPPKLLRALLWPLFCELNGIGDVHHEVSFELIQQSPGMIKAMRDFAEKPYGIYYFHGGSGTGKTYASMAICELFTRKNSSCRFMTMRQMMAKWLDTFKEDKVSNFNETVNIVELLVIDDFGTGEPPPGFMGFLLDVVNTRMQWKNRGTIITTNLSSSKIAEYTGEALSDRLSTGTPFKFDKSSRRKSKL